MSDSSKTVVTHSQDNVRLPLLPLRDVVVFPYMVIPLFVGRAKSIKALEAGMNSEDHQIMLVAQKSAGQDEPQAEDLFDIGCIATILQMLRLPDGTVKVLVEGVKRVNVRSVTEVDGYFEAQAMPLVSNDESSSEIEALRRAVLSHFDQYVKLNKKIPSEILASVTGIDDAGRFADTIAAHLPLKLEQK